jgi:hypothetical protein
VHPIGDGEGFVGVGAIDEKVVDGKAALFDQRADLGKTHVLVPAAALVEVGEGEKRQEENENLGSEAHNDQGLKGEPGVLARFARGGALSGA